MDNVGFGTPARFVSIVRTDTGADTGATPAPWYEKAGDGKVHHRGHEEHEE
jgi:hypothetical protein